MVKHAMYDNDVYPRLDIVRVGLINNYIERSFFYYEPCQKVCDLMFMIDSRFKDKSIDWMPTIGMEKLMTAILNKLPASKWHEPLYLTDLFDRVIYAWVSISKHDVKMRLSLQLL